MHLVFCRWIVCACAAITCSTLAVSVASGLELRDVRPGYYRAVTRIPDLSSGPWRKLVYSVCVPWARRAHADFIRECEASFKTFGKPASPYEHQIQGKVIYRSPRLVSILFDMLQYTGGAHPNAFYRTFNLGMVNGKPALMRLADFFVPGSDFRQQISDAIINKLMLNEAAVDVVNGKVTRLTEEQLERFVVGPEGLRFFFNHYELGPYAAGRFNVRLTVQELGTDFKRALLPEGRAAPGASVRK
ncbi:MAG: DUF3298 and DUF4163 domain-containing protein [Chloroherpetonaceae bacterium]|nr:DUF3298 and DUF4163 domain-containing protein [Chthonomonadaceae bacterium]MDW8209378.1 DUF3298 and DUF4163 domain-containing protein [Chloroherpetonaceae bacterium]